MLWYKAWLETRTRFWICLVGLLLVCAFNIYFDNVVSRSLVLRDGAVQQALLPHSREYYLSVLHKAHQSLSLCWVLAVTLLTMGGLLREKAVSTATLTLTLPLTRSRIGGARIGMSVVQSLALALGSWMTMCLVSGATGGTISARQASFHLGPTTRRRGRIRWIRTADLVAHTRYIHCAAGMFWNNSLACCNKYSVARPL
jgi:ABC-2 type transport system permease protein